MKSQWQKSRYANLRVYVPSGVFHVCAKVNGKEVRKSTGTTLATIAQSKRDEILEQARAEIPAKAPEGLETFSAIVVRYRTFIDASAKLKSHSKAYRRDCAAAIGRVDPGFVEKSARAITPDDCAAFAGRLAEKYKPSRYNGIIQTMRAIFEFADIDPNPADSLEQMRVTSRIPVLPDAPTFRRMLKIMDGIDKQGANFARLVSSSGMRKNEAANAQVEHCDFQNNRLKVVGDPTEGTKGGEERFVPMNAALEKILKKLCAGRMAGKLSPVSTCRYTLKKACKAVGVNHLTIHDLRHLFATRCIESGADIPTVAAWLGHKDRGVLLMKRYTHLMDDHSQAMAKKVRF